MFPPDLSKYKNWVRLFAAAVFLRSLIATGFMLSVSGNGLALIVCNGPVSFKPVMEQGKHHHHHTSDNTENSRLHISPSCSDWSTSSLLVFNTFFESPVFDFYTPENIYANPVYPDESVDPINLIRAPPSLV